MPFTIDQFMDVFATYNQAVWPAQWIAYLLGLAVPLLMKMKRDIAGRYINIILGSFWIWMGGMYHINFFADVNPAALGFGAVFIVQGLLFFTLNWFEGSFRYRIRNDGYGWTGAMFIFYAMLLYPLLGYLFGHVYPRAPVFGLAPCPTTIFTFGVFLHARGRVPVWLLIIPGLWSLIGFSAAFQLGIYEDVGLIIAGVLGTILIVRRNRAIKS